MSPVSAAPRITATRSRPVNHAHVSPGYPEASTLKAKSGMAGQDRGREPTAEKHPRSAVMSGDDASCSGSPAGAASVPGAACALSIPGHQLATGLRVALVDTDPSAQEFVRQAFAAHANGWVLASHQGPDTLLEVLRPPGIRHAVPPAPSAHELSTLPPINRHLQAAHAAPDLILLDPDRPGASGADAVRRLAARLPWSRILMFTSCSEGATIIRAVDAGACGYLIKPVVSEFLVYAVGEAAVGRAVFCTEAQAAMVEYVRRTGAAKGCQTLSWRERETMLLVMRGATNKEISKELGIDEGTVHWHMNNAFKKMQVHSRGEARLKWGG